MTRTLLVSVVGTASAVGLSGTLHLLAAQQIDSASIAKIRDEGMHRSQVMEITSYLTDVYGPRLTGSPNIKAAGDWAVTTMKGWGLPMSPSSRGRTGAASTADGRTTSSIWPRSRRRPFRLSERRRRGHLGPTAWFEAKWSV